MKTLVVYDSKYGNTKAIADAVGAAIDTQFPGEVTVVHAGQTSPAAVADVDLLVVGAPTHGGGPSEAPDAFLDLIEDCSLDSVRVAAFDTRMTAWWVRVFGFAAPKMAARLKKKGGTLVGEPGDFFVKGTKGPLVEGELERAAAWARGLAAAE